MESVTSKATNSKGKVDWPDGWSSYSLFIEATDRGGSESLCCVCRSVSQHGNLIIFALILVGGKKTTVGAVFTAALSLPGIIWNECFLKAWGLWSPAEFYLLDGCRGVRRDVKENPSLHTASYLSGIWMSRNTQPDVNGITVICVQRPDSIVWRWPAHLISSYRSHLEECVCFYCAGRGAAIHSRGVGNISVLLVPAHLLMCYWLHRALPRPGSGSYQLQLTRYTWNNFTGFNMSE